MTENFNRRNFLKAITVASTGALAACTSQHPQKLIPYVVPPDDVIPGVATWYKSVCRECPAGCGTLVRTREGRVVKVEGNPDHPVNHGAQCARGQSAVQGLYNPDRLAGPMKRNDEGKFEPITWDQAEELLANTIRYLRHGRRADRIAFITERVTGSTERLLREWLDLAAAKQGQPRPAPNGAGLKLIQYEPFAYEALRAANKICFGTSEIPHLHIGRAQMLLSFGADFLETYDSPVFHTRQFAIMREEFRNYAGRFVAVGPRLSLTAANADEFLRVPADSELFVALGMLREILDAGLARIPTADVARLRGLVGKFGEGKIEEKSGVTTEQVRRIAKQFAQSPRGLALGPGVASSGELGTALQVVVNLLNYACGFVGDTVIFGRGANWDAVATHAQMFEFVRQMQAGAFDVVFFHRTNPAYSLPEAAGFRHALERVPFRVSFATAMDETAGLCDLVLPDNTPLERWEDFEPRAGVYGLAQPAMRPGFYFDSKQTEDVLLASAVKVGAEMAQRLNFSNFREYMREQWKARLKEFAPQKDFEAFWREAVEAGGVWKDVPARAVKLSEEVFRFDFTAATRAAISSGHGFSRAESKLTSSGALAPEVTDFDLIVYPRLELFDGRTANRPVIQETPDAMTKIVWDSWAEIHPDTAQKRGITEGDLLKITSSGGSIQIPAHLYEGIHPNAIAIPLGQGHTEGRWAAGRGPTPLRLLAARTEPASGGLIWSGMGVKVEKLAVNRPLARTQIETRQNPDGRDREIVQIVPLSSLLKGEAPKQESHPALSLYPTHVHSGHRWGMAIDLNSCVGCNACIAACYAENNVTFVGKDQVNRGRHMAWIRLDRYFEEKKSGELETRFMPMLCQQCDNAPCESVCPVYATYHNYEGLNVQVYNRCVGTRYCSNNCPYKVRRFNWFDYEWPWPMHLGLNPDLSARTKGVMEKCTFCIQRIRAGKDLAKDEKHDVRDGEIVPACAQTCPAQAITFGDLNDPKSRIAQLAKDGRSYHVLGELNTRPAISYLKKIVRDERG